jgi:hypothetical protein
MPNRDDRRAKIPTLTFAGHKLVSTMSSAVSGSALVRPQIPKEEALLRLNRAEDVALLSDADFDEIDWDGPEAPPSPPKDQDH